MKRGKQCLRKSWNKLWNLPKVAASEDITTIEEAAAVSEDITIIDEVVVAAEGINDLQWIVEVTTTNGRAEAAVNPPPFR